MDEITELEAYIVIKRRKSDPPGKIREIFEVYENKEDANQRCCELMAENPESIFEFYGTEFYLKTS